MEVNEAQQGKVRGQWKGQVTQRCTAMLGSYHPVIGNIVSLREQQGCLRGSVSCYPTRDPTAPRWMAVIIEIYS